MRVCPLDGKIRAFVVIHFLVLVESAKARDPVFVLDGFRPDSARACVAALSVVLAVEEAVAVVAIHVALAVTIVRSSRVVLFLEEKTSVRPLVIDKEDLEMI